MMKINKIVLFFLSSMLIAIMPVAYSTHVLLPDSNLNLPDQATLIKPVSANQPISFIVWLKLRNKNELDQLVQDVYHFRHPRYHQFLTHALYEQKFAPTQNTETAVQQFFIAHGMRAKIVNHSIRVIGSAEQIKQTLQVQLNYYQYHHKLVYAIANHPKLNTEIAPYVAEITGLSTIPQFHANIVSSAKNTQANHRLNFIWPHFVPNTVPTDISLQGFTGVNLQKAYNLNNIPPINGVKIDGTGQTLVIVDKCGTNGPDSILKDANQYFNANRIKPYIVSGPAKNFAIINADGTPFITCPNPASFSREIVLDIESSHTLAPGSNTVLVLGTDQKTTLIDTIHTLIQNNYTIAGFANAYVISNSWSGVESSADPTLDAALQTAAAAGISVNFSSGDCGDNTYNTQKKCTGTRPSSPTVDYPSSSAYVTAVGATALFVDNDYRYAFETVWGTVKSINNILSYTGGTGGGISQFYGPVAWQSDISHFTAGGYGVINHYGNRRALPDIAMLGDPQTGLLIIADGQQVQDGGTSLACPLFSATLVLVNQARSILNKGSPIGQAAPYLYQRNQNLLLHRAINLIIPPALIISGAMPPPSTLIQNTPAPASAFTINHITFGWDSTLTIEPEAQFWNDAVGVGSPNMPNFISAMANM